MSFNQELFNQLAKEYALPQTLKSAILGEDGLPEDAPYQLLIEGINVQGNQRDNPAETEH